MRMLMHKWSSPVSVAENMGCMSRFSHAVGELSKNALSVNDGAGSIENIVSLGPRGSMCSDFMVYAKVNPAFMNAQLDRCTGSEGGHVHIILD